MGKYIHKFDTVSDRDAVYHGDDYLEPWLSYTVENDKVDYNIFNWKYINMPLTFEIVDAGNYSPCKFATADSEGGSILYRNMNLWYKINDGEWTQYGSEYEDWDNPNSYWYQGFEVHTGDIIQWKSDSLNTFDFRGEFNFKCFADSVKVYGNIASIIDSTNYKSIKQVDIFGTYDIYPFEVDSNKYLTTAKQITQAYWTGVYPFDITYDQYSILRNIPVTDCTNLVYPEIPNVHNNHKYVDLGLPSGTLWAFCNVGASSPEDYGGYYAWGETFTKDVYTWNNYTLGGDPDSPNKYQGSYGRDKLSELEPIDDVANVVMGGDWRMPTEYQFLELVQGTTTGLTTLNGINGMSFTSKSDASKSIFIPFAGIYDGENSNGNKVGEGEGFALWSSEMHSYPWMATGFFGEITANVGKQSGFSVRGVI